MIPELLNHHALPFNPDYDRWDYFGERGLLLQERRSATCQAACADGDLRQDLPTPPRYLLQKPDTLSQYVLGCVILAAVLQDVGIQCPHPRVILAA